MALLSQCTTLEGVQSLINELIISPKEYENDMALESLSQLAIVTTQILR